MSKRYCWTSITCVVTIGETKCGWLARASSALRIHLCTQSLSLLFVAWLGGFCVPVPLSTPESFLFWSQAAEGSCESARTVLQCSLGSWAGSRQGNARIRITIEARIRLIGSLIGPGSFSLNGMSVVLRQCVKPVLWLSLAVAASLARNLTHCVVSPPFSIWNPGHRRSSLLQALLCRDRGPSRKWCP